MKLSFGEMASIFCDVFKDYERFISFDEKEEVLRFDYEAQYEGWHYWFVRGHVKITWDKNCDLYHAWWDYSIDMPPVDLCWADPQVVGGDYIGSGSDGSYWTHIKEGHEREALEYISAKVTHYTNDSTFWLLEDAAKKENDTFIILKKCSVPCQDRVDQKILTLEEGTEIRFIKNKKYPYEEQ